VLFFHYDLSNAEWFFILCLMLSIRLDSIGEVVKAIQIRYHYFTTIASSQYTSFIVPNAHLVSARRLYSRDFAYPYTQVCIKTIFLFSITSWSSI